MPFINNSKYSFQIDDKKASLAFLETNKYQFKIVEEINENSFYSVYARGSCEKLLDISKNIM